MKPKKLTKKEKQKIEKEAIEVLSDSFKALLPEHTTKEEYNIIQRKAKALFKEQQKKQFPSGPVAMQSEDFTLNDNSSTEAILILLEQINKKVDDIDKRLRRIEGNLY